MVQEKLESYTVAKQPGTFHVFWTCRKQINILIKVYIFGVLPNIKKCETIILFFTFRFF